MKEFLLKYAHWIVLGVAALWTVLETLPPSSQSGEIDLAELGRLPIQEGGRLKPLDSMARSTLEIISNQQEFADKDNKKRPAIRWLADVLADGDPAHGAGAQHRVFRIDYDQVLDLLGLERRPGFYRYSYAEILPNKRKLDEARARAEAKSSDKRDRFEVKVVELGERLDRYEHLAEHKTPRMVPPQAEGEEWQPLAFVDMVILSREIRPMAPTLREKARANVDEKIRKMGKDPAQLPSELKDALDQVVQEELLRLVQDAMREKRAELFPAAEALENVLTAYREGKAGRFNQAVAEYREKFFGHVPEESLRRVNFEAFLNRLTPFVLCAFLFVCAFVLTAIGWIAWPNTLHKAAFWLALLTLAIQTFALFGRMYLMDRPLVFVTNLYSSAIFIGWGCAGIGLILEVIYRNGIGVAVGSVLGATSNAIAHNLLAGSGSADTLEMMQAVLDTNLWLATHVTTVTLGYVSTLVAGAIGIFFIIAGVFTRYLDRERLKTVSSMLYGVICFATLLSFVGTVLGGIWADQSWGRFWGWDPKENGAILVVIWNALILHARWGGLIKQRGMAVLSLVGIMVTFWSWFGTNQLGVGLHAYGFSNKLALMCVAVWGSMLALICIGLMPLSWWTSFLKDPTPPEKPGSVAGTHPKVNGYTHGPGKLGSKPAVGPRP